MPRTANKNYGNVTFPLDKLAGMSQEDLGGTTPAVLCLDERKIPVRSWTDTSVEFVRFLFAQGEIQKHMLPFCPDSGTGKAFITSVPHHPDAEKDGKFSPVAENVYVDTKWNASMHVQKILATLKKRGILGKYKISIVLQ